MLRRAVELLEPRGVFVDVGANIGTATIPALRFFARAIAIEAEAGNAALLRANAALNGLHDRVVVCELACSSEAGTAALHVAAGKHGSHALRPAKAGDASGSVVTARLDDLLAREGVAPADVGLVWIDVEGHEDHVLAGAAALLAARVPLVVEVHVRTADDVVALLAGYERWLDLRDEARGGSLAELPGYLRGLPDSAGRSFTDILFS